MRPSKDIATLYLIFATVAGTFGTALSVAIRINAHGLVMIFFVGKSSQCSPSGRASDEKEVEMPQDADGSGLISLIWAAWIYWSIYWWLGRPLSPEQAEKERHGGDRLNFSGNTGTPSGLARGPVPPRLDALVSEILRRDGAAEVEDFLSQRLAAYETTIAVFDAGDRDVLRELVSLEVYDVFSQAIAVREARQEKIETVFSQIDPPGIVDGLIDETHMEVSVRFVGERFKLCRSATGEPINEMPDRCRSVDIWTFGRMLSSRDRAWRVLATEAGV